LCINEFYHHHQHHHHLTLFTLFFNNAIIYMESSEFVCLFSVRIYEALDWIL
jgi:hypothetical protein